jgi:uncharacterized protein (DUF1800 family)
MSQADAFRFLNQATFGATESAAQQLQSLGYEAWLDEQLRQPPSLELPALRDAFTHLAPGVHVSQLQVDRGDVWFRNALHGPDQLRQRVAFALSEIMVISEASSLQVMPFAMASYYDTLVQDAFGDFRDLLEDVTLHPAMGVFLSSLGNQKPDPTRNIRPDENYAREVLQLFTIGLVQLSPDGSPVRDARGNTLPTYDQDVVQGFASVFTGWSWAGANRFEDAQRNFENETLAMQAYAEQHASGTKKVLSYPGAALTEIPADQSPERDLKDALDDIFHHPNVGPFVGRLLIQRLVTSNPSPQYIERVAHVFDDDGSGQRGNLAAVVKAILLDPEARAPPTSPVAGKLKEPLLRLTQLWRAYDARSESGKYIVPHLVDVFGQGPLSAPSVFNFFNPAYTTRGEMADNGWVAPELQIATEFLNAQTNNFFLSQAFCFTAANLSKCAPLDAAGRSNAILIDVTDEQQLAGDPSALVRRIAARLLGGEISDSLRMQAIAAVERAPPSDPGQRVAEALYLISSSPEYAQQR